MLVFAYFQLEQPLLVALLAALAVLVALVVLRLAVLVVLAVPVELRLAGLVGPAARPRLAPIAVVAALPS